MQSLESTWGVVSSCSIWRRTWFPRIGNENTTGPESLTHLAQSRGQMGSTTAMFFRKVRTGKTAGLVGKAGGRWGKHMALASGPGFLGGRPVSRPHCFHHQHSDSALQTAALWSGFTKFTLKPKAKWWRTHTPEHVFKEATINTMHTTEAKEKY